MTSPLSLVRAATATINCARIRDDEAYRDELRLRAQTDLFWLAHDLLGYNRISETNHRIVVNHYVQKDPRKSIADQDIVKNRLILDPRTTFKSTMNMADTIQWILCFPDISILLLSASTKLTVAFAGEVTEHFVLPKGGVPSPFQELFPEYTIRPTDQMVGSYTAPHRTVSRKENTLMSSSIESSLSGWHYDVIKEDDIVDNRNSETVTGIAKVKKNRHINRKMLMPWGYRDTAGTRYNPFDAYGDDIANSRPGKLKVLVRPAMIINDGSRLTANRFPEPSECTLVFPDLLPYEFLREDYEADFSAFMTQYMNDAHGGKDVTFHADDLNAHTIPEDTMPATGDAIVVWRFSKPGTRYAAGVAGRVARGKTYIFDSERGIFAPALLARRIVAMARRHYVHEVLIEETPGARHLEQHIENAMLEAEWNVRITWAEYEDDDTMRDARLKSIEPLLSGHRLYFSIELPNLRDIHQQFGNYGMVADTELVDVVARVTESMPATNALAASEQFEQDVLDEMIARDRHDRLYGIGQGPMSHDDLAQPEPEELWEPELGVYGTEDIAPGLGI